MIPKRLIKMFLESQKLFPMVVFPFRSSQKTSVSKSGGNMSARHEDEKAPTREMQRSSFGTAAAAAKVAVTMKARNPISIIFPRLVRGSAFNFSDKTGQDIVIGTYS